LRRIVQKLCATRLLAAGREGCSPQARLASFPKALFAAQNKKALGAKPRANSADHPKGAWLKAFKRFALLGLLGLLALRGLFGFSRPFWLLAFWLFGFLRPFWPLGLFGTYAASARSARPIRSRH
jgi:hypothetical protein